MNFSNSWTIRAPFDEKTHEVNSSFAWGDALVVVPVLKENARTVRTYLPRVTLAAGATRWFKYRTGEEIAVPPSGLVELEAPLEYLPHVVRGGAIIPSQIDVLNYTSWKVNTFQSCV